MVSTGIVGSGATRGMELTRPREWRERGGAGGIQGTAVDERQKEIYMNVRVGRHQADRDVDHANATRAANWPSSFERDIQSSFI